MEINKELFEGLFIQAGLNERKRINYDLRTDSKDGGQRMLNVLMPDTIVPIHRHPMSNESIIVLSGKLIEIFYEEDNSVVNSSDDVNSHDISKGKRYKEVTRYVLDPTIGNFGCVIPKGTWHTVKILEPCVIYEAKDGKYGEDGSEILDIKHE